MLAFPNQDIAVPVVPRLFTLAAVFEGVDLPTFLQDPTRCTTALYQTWSWFRYGAIFAYHDDTLLAEACGVPVTWTGSGFSLAGAAPVADPEPGAVLTAGRLPVALEVARRLAAQVRGEARLAVLLPGPWSLAAQLAGEAGTAVGTGAAALESARRVLHACARAFLEAGVDLLWVLEPAEPAAPHGALRSMANLVNFYRKGLVVEGSGGSRDALAFLQTGCDGVVIKATAGEGARALDRDRPRDRWLGLALPISESGPNPALADLRALLAPQPGSGIFWTTDAEIRGWTAEQFTTFQELFLLS